MTKKELDDLDLAVAKVLGMVDEDGTLWMDGTDMMPRAFRPTRNWNDCGPLIQKFGVVLDYFGWPAIREWEAGAGNHASKRGDTPQIAICKAVVEAGGNSEK